MHHLRFTPPLLALGTVLMSATVHAQSACPSPDIADVLRDPVVDAAMDSAWAASDEGITGAEHEEGGWIYQCRTPLPAGGFTYTTEVDVGVGTFDLLRLPPRRTDPACRLVGDFHTHPGVAASDPRSNDPYANDQPSPTDLASGLPGIITYGLGPTRGGGATTDITYGPSTNPDLVWRCEEEASLTPRPASYNDPHLITLDGLGYDFQAAGEFALVLSELDGLQVQSRQSPVASGLQVSMNTALAFEVGADIVSVQFDESTNLLIFVNGAESSVRGEQMLPDGGVLSADTGAVTLRWADGSIAAIRVRSSFLNLSLALAPRHASRVSGLLGDFDGEVENDLRGAEGVTLPIRPSANDLYGPFADNWRVSEENSLFVYFDGESTETFTDRLFPGRVVEVDDLAADDRARASAACEGQGIVDPLLLRNCILDVGLSGDVEFAQASGELQETFVPAVAVAEVQGRIDTPEFACVDPVTVDASGNPVPAIEGRYGGTISNPDSGGDWTATLDLRQCGVEVAGLLLIERPSSGGSAEQYRRVEGEWSEGRLSIALAFPFTFSSVDRISPCRDMVATLETVDEALSGPWTSSNCALGGVFDLVRTGELGPQVESADFVGTWTGPVDQPGAQSYSLRMVLRQREDGTIEGTADYPELDCGKTLTGPRIEDGELVLLETLIRGRCGPLGTVRLQLTEEDTIAWSYARAGAEERVIARAVLSRE